MKVVATILGCRRGRASCRPDEALPATQLQHLCIARQAMFFPRGWKPGSTAGTDARRYSSATPVLRTKLTHGCVKLPRKEVVGVQIDAHFALARAMLNGFQIAELQETKPARRSYE